MEFLDPNNKKVSVSASRPLPTAEALPIAVATGQITVAATATVVVPVRTARKSITITNLGAVDVFIGAAGVTAATGHLLSGVKGQSITLATPAAISAIVGVGTQAVSFIEVY